MINVSRYLRREWEQVCGAVIAVLLLLFLADWALHDRATDSTPGSGRIVESPTVLGPGAFAFLQDAAPGAALARNPFLSSAIETPAARPAKPPRSVPPKTAPAQPKPPPPPVAPRPAPPEPARAAVPAPPTRRLGWCEVKYVFSTTNRSGRPVALIELQDPAQPGAAPLARNVSAGDQACGLRIQSFSDEALILVDAAGRRQSVSFGGTRRVTADFGPTP
jgi:hypothetical protein